MNPGTESVSRHKDLEKLDAYALVKGIHSEDLRISGLVLRNNCSTNTRPATASARCAAITR